EDAMYIKLYMNYNKEHNKPGYFVVGWELINRLYFNLLSHGYRIPNRKRNGGSRIRPDRSVQPAFFEFLRAKYINMADKFVYGEIVDPEEEMTIRAKHFRNEYLP